MPNLPEGALVEILSRVPYRSLCRFKCVSKPWLALRSRLDICKRSPQTLSGLYFFGEERGEGLNFHDLAGGGPPLFDVGLSFLASYYYEQVGVEKCCGGLLLCVCWKPRSVQVDFDYVVCNPATEKCTVLPAIEVGNRPEAFRMLGGHLCHIDQAERFLGFDTANPSSFVVVVPLATCFDVIKEVAIYSSETGGWNSMQSQHNDSSAYWVSDSESTFLNGIMYFPTRSSSIVTLDMKRNAWGEIEMPPGMPNNYGGASIGQSQGRLHVWEQNQDGCQLSVWILENYATGQWNLKCTVNCLELIGRDSLTEGEYYRTFAIHPDCDLIFLIDNKEKALSYDMTSQKVHVISSSGDFLGGLPYIPYFAEWKSDGH